MQSTRQRYPIPLCQLGARRKEEEEGEGRTGDLDPLEQAGLRFGREGGGQERRPVEVVESTDEGGFIIRVCMTSAAC